MLLVCPLFEELIDFYHRILYTTGKTSNPHAAWEPPNFELDLQSPRVSISSDLMYSRPIWVMGALKEFRVVTLTNISMFLWCYPHTQWPLPSLFFCRKRVSLLDNAPNYLVECVIQKRSLPSLFLCRKLVSNKRQRGTLAIKYHQQQKGQAIWQSPHFIFSVANRNMIWVNR